MTYCTSTVLCVVSLASTTPLESVTTPRSVDQDDLSLSPHQIEPHMQKCPHIPSKKGEKKEKQKSLPSYSYSYAHPISATGSVGARGLSRGIMV